jgi:hypothetical protein
LTQVALFARSELSHDAEIVKANATVGQQKEISRVRVPVEISVLEDLGEE